MNFGTGAVKITPAHDPNDFEVGQRHKLEFINIFTDDGNINSNAGPDFEGMPRFNAPVAVTEALKKRAATTISQAPSASSSRQPTSTARESGEAHKKAKGVTTEALASVQSVIEDLVGQMVRQKRLEEEMCKSGREIDPDFKYGCAKVLTYYEAIDLARKIENKDRAERATYDVHKKAKIVRTSLEGLPSAYEGFRSDFGHLAAPTRNTTRTVGTETEVEIMEIVLLEIRDKGGNPVRDVKLSFSCYYSREILLVEYVYRDCQIIVEGRDIVADLILLNGCVWQLWWGHRIPAWYVALCDDKQKEFGVFDDHWIVARNEEEALDLASRIFSGKEIVELSQDPDVLDTLFSAGLFPLSVLGWPDNTADLKAFYPASVLETGHDLIFFGVARMVMLGIKLGGNVPFSKVNYPYPPS
ncbi:hypothetical protein FXO37_18581 [Capsicum annuum]|nr:hypothetical protein FXO37_18581 [Capsicum annuum]